MYIPEAAMVAPRFQGKLLLTPVNGKLAFKADSQKSAFLYR
jgi:hypothetical protein